MQVPKKMFAVALIFLMVPAVPTSADTGEASKPEQRPRVLTARPNIVYILADDMGYGDVGSYNPDSNIPTPNMDLLAKQGIRFTDAHSGDSVCTPSRYSLLTGRYGWRSDLKSRVLFNYEPPLIEPQRMTVASLLQDNGYATAMIGKWHLGLGFTAKAGESIDFNKPLPWHGGSTPDKAVGESIDFTAPAWGGPNDLGFDYAFYTAGCSTDQEPYCFVKNKKFLDMENATYRRPAGSWRSGMASPSWVNETVDVTFTEQAVSYIKRIHEAHPPEPFFLYLALSAPHSPHLIPKFASNKSDAGVRGDMVWLVDWSVGEITKVLEEHDLTDSTLLIVSSDNGPLVGSLEPGKPEGTARISNGHQSAGGLRGFKAQVFEGGHRVSMIARWPGSIPAGAVNDRPVNQLDLLATCAALVDTDLPRDAGEDSFNMLPELLHVQRRVEDGPGRTTMIHHSGNREFAFRKGKWKIIFANNERKDASKTAGLLYNMESDPSETTNLWDQYPHVVADLREQFDKQFESGRSRP